jgi:glycosyltransferase involved in cell wall biosynthesis
MKLNWFSPLPPAKTDIAHYTARILPALRAHAEVTLWTDQKDWDESLNLNAKVRRYRRLERMPWAELNRADMSIYNIGNNPIFHGSIWEVSQRHPGVIVLHDYSLQEFFYSLYLGRWEDLAAYLTQMEFYYGESGRREAEACFRNKGQMLSELAERYPLTKLALENALGVLVHTREALDKLKRDGHCPLTYAPLPFAATCDARGGDPPNPDSRAEGPPYRLIVFGYLARNRRLEELLKALAEFGEREQFHLDVYGQLSNEKELRQSIRLLQLEKHVTVYGFVPEAELERALSTAHLAINLRYPTAGEASGSQLRLWSHALPSLVTEVGWYATLPEDAVCLVRATHEIEDILRHLKAFLSDPSQFAAMGRKGFALYQQQHLPEHYAAAVLSLVSAAQAFRPIPVAQKLILKTKLEMGRWLQPMLVNECLDRIAAEKAQLLYGRSVSSSSRQSLTKRVKRFIRRRLPRRVYAYYVAQRDRLRGY